MAGGEFTYILMKDSTVKVTGRNFGGQLGIGTDSNINILQTIADFTNVKEIKNGAEFTFFFLENGEIYYCGNSYCGALGFGRRDIVTKTPTKYEVSGIDFSKVKQLEVAQGTTYLLFDDGTVMASGYNQGAFGDAFGSDTLQFTTLPIVNVEKIYAHTYTTFYLMKNGDIKVAGDNTYGQYGDGTFSTTSMIYYHDVPLKGVKDIRVGGSHTIFIMEDGSIMGCGKGKSIGITEGDAINERGAVVNPIVLDIGNMSDIKEIYCDVQSTIILYKDGTVKACMCEPGLGLPVGKFETVDITNVCDICAFAGHTLFLLDDGTVKGCGVNGKGQLGTGDITNRSNIIDITTGAKQWHDFNHEINIEPIPPHDKYNTDIGYIEIGGSVLNTFVKRAEDGVIECCGANINGSLGLWHGSPMYNLTESYLTGEIKKIVAGQYTTVFLMKDGTVKFVGDNKYDQFKTGEKKTYYALTDSGLTNIKDIVIDESNVFIILNDGTIQFLGMSYYGQSGLGPTTFQVLEYTDVPIGSKVKKLIAQFSHTIAILEDGSVKACGQNMYGDLGVGDTGIKSIFTDVPVGGKVKDAACTPNNVYYLLEDGTVKGAGKGTNGMIVPNPDNTLDIKDLVTLPIEGKVKLIQGQYNNVLFLLEDGTVVGCGNNSYGTLGGVGTGDITEITKIIDNVQDIYGAQQHTIFLMNDGTVKGCGKSNMGQLGNGSNTIIKEIVDLNYPQIVQWHNFEQSDIPTIPDIDTPDIITSKFYIIQM